MMDLKKEERDDYIKRLFAGPPKDHSEILKEGEIAGLKELFPDYYEKFDIIKKISEGAYKKTIQLRNPKDGEMVAFKVVPLNELKERAIENLKNDGASTPLEAFEKESRRMDKICSKGNPHITVSLGSGHFGDYYFFMEEYSERTLLDYIKTNHKKHPLTEASVVYSAKQLADGLYAIHEEELYHGDLHPDNILFKNSELRITDFDMCSSIFGFDENRKYLVPHAETRAPELYEGKRLDGRIDVWACAIDIIFMKNGKMPFPKGFNGTPKEYELLTQEERDDLRQNIYRHIKDDKWYNDVMDGIKKGFGFNLANVLIKSLQRNPDDRYKDGIELYEALDV